MKQWLMATLLMGFTLNVYASELTPALDTISFQLSAERWVETQSAMLRMTVHATLAHSDIVRVRNNIMEKLQHIAKGQWHVTNFTRSQDSSGLETLTVKAEARVNPSVLTDVYQLADKSSKPGESYQVTSIEFKPSLAEINTQKNKLRHNLYQQINNEIQLINKQYKNQQYSLYQLVLTDGNQAPDTVKNSRQINLMAVSVNAPPLSVQNKLSMQAYVTIASNRANKS